MPEYLSPGVYVEEIDTGNKPIEGVGTSTAGFVGLTVRGPTKPRFVTSFGEFARVFGRYRDDAFLPHAVEGFFTNGGKRCFVARAVPLNDSAKAATFSSGDMTVEALGPGAWPNNQMAFKIETATASRNPNGVQGLFKLTVIYWEKTPPQPIVDPTDPAMRRDPNRLEPTVVEIFDNLSEKKGTNSFYEKQINDVSILIKVTAGSGGGLPDIATSEPAPLKVFDNGEDGDQVTAEDIKGNAAAEPDKRTGLTALAAVDEIAILCCPEEVNGSVPNSNLIAQFVVDQCEALKDRFAIIQAPQAPGAIQDHYPSVASKYAAYYYPWLQIAHPVTGLKIEVPPGGHMAGIYARVDIERGVHKAPANERIRGLDPGDDGTGGLQLQVSTGQQDLLNPRGVNVLRYFTGYGNLVWGARTTTPDPDWKYINVRRLFIFVEESIEEATQWAVFEPNDEPLWARLRRSVSAFLRGLWMNGQLQGEKAERAYFVKCDRTTMTQADIDNGKLIMVIGIAPVKPAEFVIFRIGQWDGGHSIEENKA